MATLLRPRAGDFVIDKAVTLEELEALSAEEREALLLPVHQLFSGLSCVCLPDFYRRLCSNGCEIYQKKIRTVFAVGERVRLCTSEGEFFALGEVREYPEGTAIKAIKTF